MGLDRELPFMQLTLKVDPYDFFTRSHIKTFQKNKRKMETEHCSCDFFKLSLAVLTVETNRDQD